ncbi:hypothetical protein [Paraburkholderia metrosideri]|uniref:hypothetical protein n=1 Tax=Paraburkholderia metrosideri TaxID=580937 RepID=UPI00191A8A5E|nr:hypothetical protein [Paraburkholderia metrosideri]
MSTLLLSRGCGANGDPRKELASLSAYSIKNPPEQPGGSGRGSAPPAILTIK